MLNVAMEKLKPDSSSFIFHFDLSTSFVSLLVLACLEVDRSESIFPGTVRAFRQADPRLVLFQFPSSGGL